MKYNKINEFLVKEAFKPKHNLDYFQDENNTFLCIDGFVGLKIPNVVVFVDIPKILKDRKPLGGKSVDRLFENASSGEKLTATTELFQNGKMTCNVYTLSDGQKVFIDRELLKYFEEPTLYTAGIKRAVYVKEKDYGEFCAVVMPVNNY